jgi:hypothetical protein
MSTKTLLQIIQTTVAEMSKMSVPTVVLTSGDPNILKLTALLNAVLDDLTSEYNWQFLQQRNSFFLVPNQESYDLPPDFVRFINGTIFDATNRWPIRVVTPIQWEIINIWNVTASPFERLRMFQNQLFFFPIPNSNFNIVFDYISSFCIQNANTGDGQSSFMDDSDLVLFDSRLVINGLKLKYLGSVGEDTTVALSEYTRRLELAKGQDSPAPTLSMLPQTPKMVDRSNIPDGNYSGGVL